VILVSYLGIIHKSLLVMDKQESECIEKARKVFQEQCEECEIKFTDNQMKQWKIRCHSVKHTSKYKVEIEFPEIID